MSFFFFLLMKLPLDIATLRAGLLPIAGFLLLGFVADLLLLPPTPLAATDPLIRRSVGRVALLYFAVFVGLVLAAFEHGWFLWPFVILKMLADIQGIFQLAVRPQQSVIPILDGVKFSHRRSFKK